MKRVLISSLGLTPGVVTGALFALEALGYGPIDKVITLGTGVAVMRSCEKFVRETLREAKPELVYETRRPTTNDYLVDLAAVDKFRVEVQHAIEQHVADDYHVLLNVTGGRRSMTVGLMLGAQYVTWPDDAPAPLTVFHMEVDPNSDLEGKGSVTELLAMTSAEERRPFLRPAEGAIRPVDISILLPVREPVAQWGKLFEYAVGTHIQKREGRNITFNFKPSYLDSKGLGEVDVFAADGERPLLVECKLRVGPDPAEKPVTATEVQKLLRKRAAVERHTGRPAEARLFSNTPLAEAEALALAAAEGATIWCVTLPDNWRQRVDWAFADARPTVAAPWDVAEEEGHDG